MQNVKILCHGDHTVESLIAKDYNANPMDIGILDWKHAGRPIMSGQDTGKSISRLVQISHTHIQATAPLVFILVPILYMTQFIH